MLDFDKYKNKLQRPTPPTKPYLMQAADPAEIRSYADQVEVFQNSEDAYREAMRRYHAESGRLFVLFIADVLEDNGLTGHPKADKIFRLASAATPDDCRAYADQLKEISYWVADLADLLLK